MGCGRGQELLRPVSAELLKIPFLSGAGVYLTDREEFV